MNTMHQLHDQFIELVQIQREKTQQNVALASNGAVNNGQQQSEGMGESAEAKNDNPRPVNSNSRQQRLEKRAQEREEVARQRSELGLPLQPPRNLRLAERVRTLELQMNLEHEEEAMITHLFTLELMLVPLLNKFKMPQAPLYYGTMDSEDYLRRYNSHTSLYRVSCEIACRAFDSTLIGAASSLPEPKEKLVTMYRGPNKTLKSSIERYTAEVSKTKDFDDEATLIGALSSTRGDITF
ncbi:hypothetical protein TIFTF001_035408 [Ficus carica]|uniref:Uncharacterized protein n=1 Tax=Ficus carica TaxID=3494 RepID=A0AA88E5K7_FICCA|nr:hypothetical protein TIFTF001_035408 [Ficus carica]